MISQILPFVCPEFSVIIEMTDHFFLEQLEKISLEITMEVLEMVQTTFKRMPHFLTNVQLISNSTD